MKLAQQVAQNGTHQIKNQEQGDDNVFPAKDITVIKNDKKNYTPMQDNSNKNGFVYFIPDNSNTITNSILGAASSQP